MDRDRVLSRAAQWAVHARAAQVALDLCGADRDKVAVQAGMLLDLDEDIERAIVDPDRAGAPHMQLMDRNLLSSALYFHPCVVTLCLAE